MTEDLGTRLTGHFGTLRQLDTAGSPLPDTARTALRAGLPAQVAPYFSATDDEPLPLGDFAASIDAPHLPPDAAAWWGCRVRRGSQPRPCAE